LGLRCLRGQVRKDILDDNMILLYTTAMSRHLVFYERDEGIDGD
jgi:hypothetical protein